MPHIQKVLATRNHLLAALPPSVLTSLLPKFESVELPLRQILYAADATVNAVYFPESGFISLVAILEEGVQAEVGLIGNEGMVGLPVITGIETSFVEATVQASGTGLRMEVRAFCREVGAIPSLKSLLQRYSEVLQNQTTQTAACNGHHDLEQRLARWLLMAHDRLGSDEMALTQDFMAVMLGVHRPSITVMAGILQRAGLIRYRAGLITVLDRVGLEAASCECYDAIRRRTQRIFNKASF